VTLEENVLRQQVTTDMFTKGGAFDVMTIVMYETPIWAKNDWLVPLDDHVPHGLDGGRLPQDARSAHLEIRS
jgi:hypothetical protein